jgi:hypothetical protein
VERPGRRRAELLKGTTKPDYPRVSLTGGVHSGASLIIQAENVEEDDVAMRI